MPCLIVRGTAGEDGLDPSFRTEPPWPEERKRALIERGYRLAHEELARSAHVLTVPEREGRQGPGQAVGPRAGGKSGPGEAGA